LSLRAVVTQDNQAFSLPIYVHGKCRSTLGISFLETHFNGENGMVEFDKAKSDFELLDKLRVRYQMFATDIHSLSGILLGYRLAKSEEYESNIQEFGEYLSKKNSVNPHAVSWMAQISEEAKNPEYEIPIFFENLDGYRDIEYEELGEVELSWDQRDFDFRRRLEVVNLEYPEIPLKPPHKLQAVRIPNVKVHAFFIDECGKRYYEQCLGDMEHLKKWASECFNINNWG
jgi:hypothetical protein